MKIEKERSWLLKRPSEVQPDEILLIVQFYLPEYRLRYQMPARPTIGVSGSGYGMHDIRVLLDMREKAIADKRPFGNGKGMPGEWIHCEKKDIDGSSCWEDERTIHDGLFPFPHDVFAAETAIGKTRYIYNTEDNGVKRKWEMDVFGDNMSLVKLELEIPEDEDISAPLDIPQHLAKYIITETTGLKWLTNRALALPNIFKK
jgi:hypothetical protein